MTDPLKSRRERWNQVYSARRDSARERKSINAAWKIVIFVIGVTVVIFGALLLVLPGPGWPTILLGLIILSSEFAWANRFLDPVKRTTQRVSNSVKDRTSRRQQIAIMSLLIFVSVVGTVLVLIR
jgi:uncharacterized protein (TIGR02611 family)